MDKVKLIIQNWKKNFIEISIFILITLAFCCSAKNVNANELQQEKLQEELEKYGAENWQDILSDFEDVNIVIDDKNEEYLQTLIENDELAGKYSNIITKVVDDLKHSISTGEQLDDSYLENLIIQYANDYGVNISEEDMQKIINSMNCIQNINYNFSDLEKLAENWIEHEEDFMTGLEKFEKAFMSFIEAIVNFFKSLFDID